MNKIEANFPQNNATSKFNIIPHENDLVSKAEEIEKMILRDFNLKENEKEKFYDIFKNFFLEHGGIEYKNWASKMQEIARKHSDLLIRREDPKRIASAIDQHEDLNINYSAFGAQPNAAILDEDLSGLKIALAGGFGKIGKGSVALSIGFKQSKKLHVFDLPKDEYHHFSLQDHLHAKIVEGKVDIDDIKFVLMRMPRKFFPEKYMTDEEIDKENLAHIQRMFVFETKKEGQYIN